MPELNPRRVASAKGRFAQVAAAVLAGMAAMFCLQNVIAFRREAALPVAPTSAPPAAAEPERALPAPEAVRRPIAPAPSSILLKPEPGLRAAAAVIGVSGEEAPPRHEEEVAAAPKKEMPHLQDRSMSSSFASSAVRNAGRFSAIKRRAVPASPISAASAPKPLLGASEIKLIDKNSAAPENLQAALIAQIAPPERIFWTKERQVSVGTALALMIFGVIYLIYASGIRNEPPARGEGEL